MSDMIYVGIDPGFSGGIVVLNDKQEVIINKIMPVIKGKKTEYDMQSIIEIFEPLDGPDVRVALERQHVRPVSGKRACFTIGFGFGMLQMLLEINGFSYEIVNPTVWMKEIFKGFDYKDKKASVMFCKRKWPKEDWTPTERSNKPSDGLTDAACLALYCYRLNKWSR